MNPTQARFLLQSERFLLGLLAAIIVLTRCLTFYEPYERDLMVYAVTAHEVLAGRPLYADLWDIKPPGIYFVYGLSQLLCGYNRFSIFLLGISSAIITLIGIYRTVKVLTGREIIALWAAFLWALLCSDILLQANQPNVEVFLNAGFVWALLYFVKACPEFQNDEGESSGSQLASFSLRNLFYAGFLWGLASLFKQVALTTPLFLILYLLMAPGRTWPRRFLATFALLAPVLILWIGVAAYFAATHRWDVFYFTMVDYGRYYAVASARFASRLTWSQRIFPEYIALLLPILTFCLAGWLFSERKLSRVWLMLILCGLSIAVAVVAPGNYFAHYYQLWLPWICIVAGVAANSWRQSAKNELWVVKITFATALITMICQWVNWNLTPQQVSIRKYSSSLFVALPAQAQRIDALLLPQETFYQYGYDAGFYFETRRRPPIGILNVGTPYVLQPHRFQQKILLDLAATRPEMAIIDTLFPASDVTRYLYRNYVRLPGFEPPKHMLILARRGGNLLARQLARTAAARASHAPSFRTKSRHEPSS